MTFEFHTTSTTSINPTDHPADIINGRGPDADLPSTSISMATNTIESDPLLDSIPSTQEVSAKTVAISIKKSDPDPLVFEFEAFDGEIIEDIANQESPPSNSVVTSEPTPDIPYELKLREWEIACDRATEEHAQLIKHLEDEHTAAAIEAKSRKDAYKVASDSQKAALCELYEKMKEGPLLPEKPSQQPQVRTSETEPSVNPETASRPNNPAPSPAINSDESWRMIPASEVITESIEGLGKKKRELLLDKYKTLGDLEDERGNASLQHKHFSELLPDGIGKGMADKIEERMLEAIAKSPIQNT